MKEMNMLQEIRLRINKPMMIYYNNKEFFVDENGRMISHRYEGAKVASQEDLKEILDCISKYSYYAYEEDIKNGYITIEGGHRVGLAGKVALENGEVKTIRNITCLNIRISHEIKGCADKVIPQIVEDNRLLHTLIISPPKCGKTTLLRDIIRQLSDGNKFFEGATVGLVDERSEIAGSYRGVPQNDIGIRTDILDSCNKNEGMIMLIRSMSPSILAIDEIGSEKDVSAIRYALNSGCKMVCTVHASSIKELEQKPKLNELINNHIFERYIFLENENNIGDIKKIYDKEHKMIALIMNRG
jgi:stage III sporulation protein AA